MFSSSKVVADGAVSFYLDRWVTTRVARVSSGLEVCTEFDDFNSEHVRRRSTACRQPSGRLVVDGQFHCFVSKACDAVPYCPVRAESDVYTQGTKVAESTNIAASFYREIQSVGNATSFEAEIICYKGDLPVVRWMDKCRGMCINILNPTVITN